MGTVIKSVKIKLNQAAINALSENIKKAAQDTMEALKDEIVNSRTMPFNTGTMQNGDTASSERNGTYPVTLQRDNKIQCYLVTNTPYARYQYFGMAKDKDGNYSIPINYQTGKNQYARSHWLEPYLDGEFLKETFDYFLSERLKGK